MRENLKSQRIKKGYSDVEKFALSIGISASHYYKIEQGKRTPNIFLAKKIADALNKTIDEIFFNHKLDEMSS